MKKIIMSLSIIAAVGAVVIGGTTAYYSDVETSTGNTFTAGSVDLVLGSTAVYNGMVCTDNVWVEDNDPSTPTVGYPVAGDSCDETWQQVDGETGITNNTFFNFTDVKPGDWGYDKLTTKVVDNDAYALLVIDSGVEDDLDGTCTGPEMKTNPLDDPQCAVAPYTPGLGELDDDLFMMAWNDDGDGIKQANEALIFVSNSKDSSMRAQGENASGWSHDPQRNPAYLPLADMDGNTVYTPTIGWCLGLPTGVDAGFTGGENMRRLATSEINLSTCNGSAVDNRSQSDTIAFDMTFEVEQKRNNIEPSWMPQVYQQQACILSQQQ